ncbi:putative transcription factor bZIP family [Helianthus annuus]|nr:putative transcription factor bZIP family [Helianthus annuus]KAJ0533552.1 putative transcription factor bZIP family [Helianthus annuus]KAJ0541823.1 putative transcription factor bZIP family [Helianthus annuus]KAJ0706899.1 putative transcription factor bZIP family [Helianthus annuus]KAJ0710918.1 putative transcription factor bZIP family [Helianthus annuus]
MFNACFAWTSKKSSPRLIDETVIPPAEVTQEGVDLAKVTFEQYVKHAEDAAKAQSSSVAKEIGASSAKHVQEESMKEKEPEGVAHTDSSDADDESSETESEIDKSKLGVGKVQLKKKPQKKKKGSDDEDETYIPTPQDEKKKHLKKHKAVQSGVIPRSVRGRKGFASVHETQSGKSEKHVQAPEVQTQSIPEAEVQSVEKPIPEKEKAPESPEYVRIEKKDDAETPKPKKTSLPGLFEGFPNVQGEFTDDILPDAEYDMFHDAIVKELTKKVSLFEKENVKAEAERGELTKQLEKLTKVNEEMKSVVKNHAKRIKSLVEDVDDNAKLFEQLSAELSEVNAKYANMNETNLTLHQMLDELHEASANEIKVLKLEIQALRADKAVKDEQLNMLYTVMEHHLGINVQSIYNNLEIQRVEE